MRHPEMLQAPCIRRVCTMHTPCMYLAPTPLLAPNPHPSPLAARPSRPLAPRPSPPPSVPALTLKPDVAPAQALRRYRAAFLYELPSDGQPVEGGAVCAIMADVSRRFTPHLSAWRAPDGVADGPGGGAAEGRLGVNGSEPRQLVGHGEGGKGGRGRARARGKGKGRGKRELKQRQLKRAKRAAAGQRQALEGSGRPLSQLYGTR